MRINKALLGLLPMLALAGCPGPGPASLAGECHAFTDPGFKVEGKRLIDKRYVGAMQETGIEVCGWKRPKR